jgi:release factor glutamine methyltransferase
MDEFRLKVRNAFNKTLARISPLYAEPESTSIVELVFRNLLNISRIELYQRFDSNLSNSQQFRLEEIVIELENFRPLQYILGETEFYGLIFKVGPGILIPRAETEELIEWIVNDSKKNSSLRVLDIGTGSGCIAVSLAKNLTTPVIDAIDVSEEALKYARKNAAINNCTVNFSQQDIFSFEKISPDTYDIIVSNPPYVPESDKNIIQPNILEYEPQLALFVPDSDPLLFYRRILNVVLLAGKPGCKVYFEIHENFGKEIHELFESQGFEDIALRKDIHGKDRMVAGKIPSIIL